MHQIILTRSVQLDIERILIYSVDTFGKEQSKKYYNGLLATINKIGSMPTIGHIRKDLPSKYKSYLYGEHSIIYTTDDKSNVLTIARILHSHMDFTQKL